MLRVPSEIEREGGKSACSGNGPGAVCAMVMGAVTQTACSGARSNRMTAAGGGGAGSYAEISSANPAGLPLEASRLSSLSPSPGPRPGLLDRNGILSVTRASNRTPRPVRLFLPSRRCFFPRLLGGARKSSELATQLLIKPPPPPFVPLIKPAAAAGLYTFSLFLRRCGEKSARRFCPALFLGSRACTERVREKVEPAIGGVPGARRKMKRG